MKYRVGDILRFINDGRKLTVEEVDTTHYTVEVEGQIHVYGRDHFERQTDFYYSDEDSRQKTAPLSGVQAVQRITELMVQRDQLEHLCGEILATLQLPANQNSPLSSIPTLVQSWARRFKEVTQ